MAKRKPGIIGYGIRIALLLAGIFYTLKALWSMCLTVMFVHEAVTLPAVVTDIRQRSFQSNTEALSNGNLSTAGDTAYLPIITFTLPCGISFARFETTIPDNTPYTIGQQVEVITYPYNPNDPENSTWQPEAVRLSKAKFLWGGDALLLLFGLTLGGIGWLLLPHRPKVPSQKEAPASRGPKHTPRKNTTPQQAVEDPPFTLPAEEPHPPKKKRAPRKKKATEGTDGAATPPKKKKSGTAKPRKKKSDAASN